MGYPDMGLVTATEMLTRIDEASAAGVPIIADADTGFGGPLNVARSVRAYEKAGVAALHIEDQTFPKRCGLMSGVEVVPLAEARARIVAAVEARTDPDTMVIARTDALGTEGLDKACARMEAYLDDGADMAFVEGLETPEIIEAVARRLPGPKLINFTRARAGLPMPLDALRDLGFAVAIVPGDVQSAAIAAMREALAAIVETGETSRIAARLASPELRDGIVGTAAMVAADERWSKGR
jgi:2-methylisocitrate lyase-like PEP mutase family enzyme